MASLVLGYRDAPYFALSPGPADSVEAWIEMEDVEVHPLSGDLLLTTVSVRSIRRAEQLWAWFDRSVDIVPQQVIVPDGRTREEIDEINRRDMERSQTAAAAAAFRTAGFEVGIVPTGVRVVEVDPVAPAAQVLRAGDVIVAANGRPVAQDRELVEVVDTLQPGDKVELGITRGEIDLTAGIPTVARPDEPERPMIGILIETELEVELPHPVAIDAGTIGGPSAGLVFAIAIVDLLGLEDLVQGRTIAGTGVINVDGEVRPVGGIVQKVIAANRAGAHLFIAPQEVLRVACGVAGDVEIIGVESLQQAIEALRGADVPAERSCP